MHTRNPFYSYNETQTQKRQKIKVSQFYGHLGAVVPKSQVQDIDFQFLGTVALLGWSRDTVVYV